MESVIKPNDQTLSELKMKQQKKVRRQKTWANVKKNKLLYLMIFLAFSILLFLSIYQWAG